MQVLKEDVREAILKAAEDEFLCYGYNGSSLRRIASNAGITAANLYRYFKNKESIFRTLIMPAVATINSIIEHEVISMDSLKNNEVTDLIEMMSGEVAKEFMFHRKSMLLLLKKSEGTRFIRFRNEMTDHFASHIIEHFKSENIDSRNTKVRIFPKAYAVSAIESIAVILSENEPDEVISENLKLYLKVLIINFIQIIEMLRGSK